MLSEPSSAEAVRGIRREVRSGAVFGGDLLRSTIIELRRSVGESMTPCPQCPTGAPVLTLLSQTGDGLRPRTPRAGSHGGKGGAPPVPGISARRRTIGPGSRPEGSHHRVSRYGEIDRLAPRPRGRRAAPSRRHDRPRRTGPAGPPPGKAPGPIPGVQRLTSVRRPEVRTTPGSGSVGSPRPARGRSGSLALPRAERPRPRSRDPYRCRPGPFSSHSSVRGTADGRSRRTWFRSTRPRSSGKSLDPQRHGDRPA